MRKSESPSQCELFSLLPSRLKQSIEVSKRPLWSRLLSHAVGVLGMGRELFDENRGVIGYRIPLARGVGHIKREDRPQLCFYPKQDTMLYQIDGKNRVQLFLGDDVGTTISSDKESFALGIAAGPVHCKVGVARDGKLIATFVPLTGNDIYGFRDEDKPGVYSFRSADGTLSIDMAGDLHQRLERGGKRLIYGSTPEDTMRVCLGIRPGQSIEYRSEPRRVPTLPNRFRKADPTQVALKAA